MKYAWIFAAIVVALLALAIWLQVQRRHQSEIPPESNGFPLLVEASQKIVGLNPIHQPTPPTKEQLANFIAANREVLQTVRKALSMPCVAPSDEVEALRAVRMFRELRWLLIAEGKLREMEGNFDGAAQCYLDTVKLGKLQGGTVSFRLAAQAIVESGRRPLFEIVPHLSAQTSIRIANELLGLVESKENDALERMHVPTKLLRTSLKLTAIELALHAFKQQEKRLPQKLDELAPNYLKQIPTDEISGKSFVYRIDKSKHLVYSVGLNGKDEGGKGDDVTARLWEHLRSATFLKTYFGQP